MTTTRQPSSGLLPGFEYLAGEDDETLDSAGADSRTTGIVPSQGLQQMIESRALTSTPNYPDIDDSQIQPSSLDLRLGREAYRVIASFLPGRNVTVTEKLGQMMMHRIDISEGAVLERNCVYIIPLIEQVAFKKRISAIANPKSSTGRLDVFARVITDNGKEFDRIEERYRGRLYVEVCPRAFSIMVREGSRLVQMRVKHGSPIVSNTEHQRLQERLLQSGGIDELDEKIRDGITVKVDIRGRHAEDVVAYRAKRNTPLIDVDKVAHYDAAEFWDEVRAPADGRGIVLNPEDFYILASKNPVSVPPDLAAEMVAYDTLVGEFRVHYAGFFDPGFGDPELGASGTKAVLEVRAHEVPFLIEDGQVVGRLAFERMLAKPDKLYGQGIGSSYQRQGLVLGKHFRR